MTEIRSGIRDGSIWDEDGGRVPMRVAWAEFDLPEPTVDDEKWVQKAFIEPGRPSEIEDAVVALVVEAARAKLAELSPGPPEPRGCDLCGRSFNIGGNGETVLTTPTGFRHFVCDDRWDP